jgi:gluconokinase
MKCILSIELGTAAVRIYAFDLNGNLLGNSKGHYPTFHTMPDYSEQDPEQIFITMLYVLKNIINNTLLPQKCKVTTVCFSSSMHSILCVDKFGVPLGNAITWSDNRARLEAMEVKQDTQAAAALYEATSTPIHPMAPLYKIAWLRKNDPVRFEATAKFLSIKSYIIHQLIGGDYLIDYSLASSTGMFNINTFKWDTNALAIAGITEDHLPKAVSVFTPLGKLKGAYLTSLGLDENTKLLIGSSDGVLATLGAGVLHSDNVTVSLDDSSAVRVIGNTILKDETGRLFNYLLTENHIISGGPSNNGGTVFEWFAKQFGEYAHSYDTETWMTSLLEEANKIKPGSEGLLFLPYLLGERAPIWNADARGVYFGVNIKHERSHFLRATVEGLLYELYSIAKLISSHRPLKAISLNGTFAAPNIVAQAMADVFNKPVHLTQQHQGVSRGAYLLAATDMGIYKNLDEAGVVTQPANTFMPQAHNHSVYMQYFNIFERLSTKLSEEFEMISELQRYN